MADGAQDTYEVEELLAERIRDKGGRVLTEYLVKWVGYSTEDNTWEPHRNILDIELMHRFEARRCAPPGFSAKQRQCGGLGVGTIVEANWQAEGRWFPGRVAAVHTTDTCAVTFDVDYQDGDFEEGVPARRALRDGGQDAANGARPLRSSHRRHPQAALVQRQGLPAGQLRLCDREGGGLRVARAAEAGIRF